MAKNLLNSEFYWDNNVIFQVEDELFCVPQGQLVQLSEVFADMFLLPSVPATSREGQDKEHPIVLEGYKKTEFTCLLKVIYPATESLISGLALAKEEWVSVLKLSTIWNMTKIRQYAIHRLSTDITLSPTEKILLAREYRVAAWLKEGVTGLATRNPEPTLDELVALGWETAARILWILHKRSKVFGTGRVSICFRRDAIKCIFCQSPSSLICAAGTCEHTDSPAAEFTFAGMLPIGTYECQVPLGIIKCKTCGECPYPSSEFRCSSCSCASYSPTDGVRISPTVWLRVLIEEMFGEEMKDQDTAVSDV